MSTELRTPEQFAALAAQVETIAQNSYMPSHIMRAASRLKKAAAKWEKDMKEFMAGQAECTRREQEARKGVAV